MGMWGRRRPWVSGVVVAGVAAACVAVPLSGVAQAATTSLGQRCTIVGTERADVLTGTPGRDVICGLGGADVIRALGGDDVVDAGGSNDRVDAGPGDDLVLGGRGADTLYGGAGSDRLYGGMERDLLRGGTGADILSGGDGVDTVSYSERTTGVTVDLDGRADDGGPRERDNVAPSVEMVIGGAGDDRITGSRAANVLRGGAGDDILLGRDGDDLLLGGDGADLLVGGLGSDTVHGQAGTDTASYIGRPTPVAVSLDGVRNDGTFTAPSPRVGDVPPTVTSTEMDLVGSTVENVVAGLGSDVVIGSDAANDLDGAAGDDLIVGGPGDDRITGGFGSDVLRGGEGDDVLVATPVQNSDYLGDVNDLDAGPGHNSCTWVVGDVVALSCDGRGPVGSASRGVYCGASCWIYPYNLYASATEQELIVRLGVSDDLSGVAEVGLRWFGSDALPIPATRESGTVMDGRYVATLVLPANPRTGEWKIEMVATDQLGNISKEWVTSLLVI